jgi:hypothetical protein
MGRTSNTVSSPMLLVGGGAWFVFIMSLVEFSFD